MESNIKATRVITATPAQVSPSGVPCHVVGWHWNSAAAGQVVLTNGGGGGTALVTLDMPVGVSDNHITGMGFYFSSDCFCTLTGAGSAVTIFWY